MGEIELGERQQRNPSWTCTVSQVSIFSFQDKLSSMEPRVGAPAEKADVSPFSLSPPPLFETPLTWYMGCVCPSHHGRDKRQIVWTARDTLSPPPPHPRGWNIQLKGENRLRASLTADSVASWPALMFEDLYSSNPELKMLEFSFFFW